ncbi:MAG: hypothetical protein HY362_03215 [Candidatus Aenigmarchaeota archaeon]|nr:hypothetical protein [Candidatus Aenigmarchaeota archaeon]
MNKYIKILSAVVVLLPLLSVGAYAMGQTEVTSTTIDPTRFTGMSIAPAFGSDGITYLSDTTDISAGVYVGVNGADTESCKYSIDGGNSWNAANWNSDTGECYENNIDTTNAQEAIQMRINDSSGNPVSISTVGAIVVDTTKPTTTATADGYVFGTYANQDVGVTLSCNDGDGSGCDLVGYKIRYCTDTSDLCFPDSQYENPVVISDEGITYIRFFGRDYVSNTEDVKSEKIIIDKTIPQVSSAESSMSTITADNIGNTLTITLTYNEEMDQGSSPVIEVAKTGVEGPYSLGLENQRGGWTDSTHYEAVYDISSVDGEGNYDVNIDSAKDLAGNTQESSSNSKLFMIDAAAPSTTDDMPIDSGWTSGSVTVILTATDDGSGVSSIRYSIDNGEWQIADFLTGRDRVEQSISIEGDGNHSLTYYSVDVSGNPEDPKTIYIGIDSATPSTSVTGNGGEYNFEDWSNIPVTVMLSCTDEPNENGNSGCNTIYYRMNEDDDVTEYTGPILFPEDGTYTLYYYSTDGAGNYEDEQETDIYVDRTPPVISVSSPASGTTYTENSVELNYEVSDDLSGLNLRSEVSPCSYSLDDGENVSATCGKSVTFSELSNGMHMLTLYATDYVGNTNKNPISFYVIVPQGNQTVPFDESMTIDGDINQIIFAAGSNLKNVIVPSNIADDKEIFMDFSYIMSDGKITLSNEFTLERNSDNDYTVTIPSGTVIDGGALWEGNMNVPTLKSISDYTAPSGSVDIAIDVGAGVSLSFSKAVKVVIGGMAGKRAGWISGTGALTDITTLCDSVDNPTNIAADGTRECYIDSGSDLVIWTYHFTTFAAYTPSSTTTSNSNSNSGSGSYNYLESPTTTTLPPVVPPTVPETTTTQVSETPTNPSETTTTTSTTTTIKQGPSGLATGLPTSTIVSGAVVSIAVLLGLVYFGRNSIRKKFF